MEVRLTAYAKGHLIKKVKDMIKYQDEYRDVQSRLEGVRREIEAKTLEFEKEAQELRARVRSEFEFQRKLREIQQRAKEALKPKFSEMDRVKAQLEDETGRLFIRILPQMADDEAKQIHNLLSDLGVQNIHQEEPKPRGKLGRGCVFSLRFEADKTVFKELKKRMEMIPFQKIEVLFEEL